MIMFDVYADEITYQGLTIGRLVMPTSTLRDRVLEALHSCDEERYNEGYAEAERVCAQKIEGLHWQIADLEGEIAELTKALAHARGED